MPIEIKKTERGFKKGDFTDAYGEKCSIQESSLAEEDCVWLGINNSRMHLTKSQVKELLPLLKHFAKTGELP
jgi:hypothetical protein